MSSTDSPSDPLPEVPPRRNFLRESLAVVCGAAAGGVPTGIAVYSAADPLIRKPRVAKESGGTGANQRKDAEGFLLITSADSLPTDGTPRMFQAIDDLQDAWNKFPNTAIGAVFLYKGSDGKVVCYNARCPHLGCTVAFKSAEEGYLCPCHASSFDLAGKPANDIPPRPLDELEVKEVRGMIWVKFQNFRAGTEEKKPL